MSLLLKKTVGLFLLVFGFNSYALAETIALTCTITVGKLSRDYNLKVISPSEKSKAAVYIDDKNLLLSSVQGQSIVLDYVSIDPSNIKYKYTMFFQPTEIAGVAYGAGRSEITVDISRSTGKAWVYTNRYGTDLMTVSFGPASNEIETCRARSANKF